MSLDNLAELLRWLDPSDPDKAAERLEKIRQRIIKIYTNRGSRRAEEVFDVTLARVCEKVTVIAPTYVGDPALYFYAVAKKVHSEFLRADAPLAVLEPNVKRLNSEGGPDEDSAWIETRHQCLDHCLNQLPLEKWSLIIRFYEGDGQARIENRKKLSEELGIDPKALSLRALRIRRELLECMRGCLKDKGL